MRLTRNFYRHEFTRSQTAIRHGIDNRVPLQHTRNLLTLARWLQTLRDRLSKHYGKDIAVVISSGYRSPKLNKKVGGARNSAHMEALAADINAAGLSSAQLATFILLYMEDEPLDQLILEFDSWVHVAVTRERQKPRRSHLRAEKRLSRFQKLKTVYSTLEPDEELL